MAQAELIILTNMCMVYDDCGNVLVQERVNPDWPGLAFPGGHVEPGESFVGSVIRELREETGLEIEQPQLCGVKQWYTADRFRYVVLFFKANRFHGTLRSSDEGRVFWMPLEELRRQKLAVGMEDNLRVFETDTLSEAFYPGIERSSDKPLFL